MEVVAASLYLLTKSLLITQRNRFWCGGNTVECPMPCLLVRIPRLHLHSLCWGEGQTEQDFHGDLRHALSRPKSPCEGSTHPIILGWATSCQPRSPCHLVPHCRLLLMGSQRGVHVLSGLCFFMRLMTLMRNPILICGSASLPFPLDKRHRMVQEVVGWCTVTS